VRSPIPGVPELSTPSNWLLFLDECGLGAALQKELNRMGMNVDVVRMGDQFSRLGDGLYSMRPGQRGDYDALIQDLRGRDRLPAAIVHLWSVTPEDKTALRLADVDQAQESGFYSLLFLTQAMGDHNLASVKPAARRDRRRATRSAEGNRARTGCGYPTGVPEPEVREH
jgi:hypothetical protein